jgi:enoyl-CoA hydratase/carnithine racemase
MPKSLEHVIYEKKGHVALLLAGHRPRSEQPAVGVGLSLALQCQLRVMADTAWIGDTHTKVGRLGYRQAIVNKVVPREKLTAAFDPSLVSCARQLDQEIAESEDGAEGPRAFREKRKPVWKMR